ncbi:MAG: cytochrome c maturation protein CcmE [Paracoccaceae bacterium]
MAVGGLKKKRRIQLVVVAFLFLATATALIGYAMRDGISYFRSPTQVVESPPGPNEVFRIGGLVETGTLLRGQGETITFSVTDGATSIPAAYTGILPDLFKEGKGVVATGKFVNNTFQASEILAKHDENYMPKEVVEALKEQGVFEPTNGQ